MQRPGVQTYESTIPCAEGCRRDVIFNKATFTDPAGEVAGFIGVVVDITERKQTENEIRSLNADLTQQTAALALANRELEAFSYTVSHDVRKPLTIIYSAAQTMLELDGGTTGDAGYLARTICDASQRMEELIDSLLMLAHVSRGELVREEVNLSVCVAEIVTDLRLTAPQRPVEVLIAPDIVAPCDRRLIKLLLDNLVENAWKYSRDRHPAVIEFGEIQTGKGRTFFVRDNGAGFDMTRSALMFQPFSRLHSGSEFPGTGIGLATVQKVVQRHNGQVWGEGEEGKGATFYFTLA